MDPQLLPWWLGGAVVGLGICGAVGYAIGGRLRQSGGAGFCLGFLLGPLGWLLLLVLPDRRQRCRFCKGVLPAGRPSRCLHCGAVLGTVAAPTEAVDPVEAWEEQERIRKSVERGLQPREKVPPTDGDSD